MEDIWPIIIVICTMLPIIAVVVIIQQANSLRYKQNQINRRDAELGMKDALIEELQKKVFKLSLENAELTTLRQTHMELKVENEQNRQEVLKLTEELGREKGYAEGVGKMGMDAHKAYTRIWHKYVHLRTRLSKYETVEEDEEDA